jgi:hypothetical protein
MDNKTAYKEILKEMAVKLLHERIEASRIAMQRAKESSDNEEKGTMGDKYETSRAMSHIDTDFHARNLENARKQLAALMLINTSSLLTIIGPGAFVRCTGINYFIGTGLGKVNVEGEEIHFISPAAPVAIAMTGLKKGNDFIFNGVERKIEEVY